MFLYHNKNFHWIVLQQTRFIQSKTFFTFTPFFRENLLRFKKVESANQNAIYELKNNIQSIEQFTREGYWMKKDNEDIYVVLTKGKN